ncbi:MAG: radical SAM protein [Coriobacteriales bacterium]|nr:radical SAM protein [Coriobacteriales bacterium]
MESIGVSPVDSAVFLEHSLRALRKKNVFGILPSDAFCREAEKLKALLPDRVFPDVYFDLPLMGGEPEGMACVLDCYERCYLERASGGAFFTSLGIPAMSAPENRDDLLVYKISGQATSFFTVSRKTESFQNKETCLVSPLDQLEGLPLRYQMQPCENGFKLVVVIDRLNTKDRFLNKPYKDKLLEILRSAGCGAEELSALERASFNWGIPFYHAEYGYKEWASCVDVAAFVLTVRDQKLCDCRGIIRISEKSQVYAGERMRPYHAYQWHITDLCDQRCRHCYLFAEDARLKCISTPWDQLMLTLDEIVKDAAARVAVPHIAISGGDPILHPQFWRFAEELHNRGICWTILGNPFHLNAEVCQRLYQLGCSLYQQSMDGLQAFHDYMRKPGSFAATLQGIKLLNEAGIKTDLMATASRQNLEDILACMDIAAEHHAYGFTFARYCATSPEKAKESYPSPDEYRDFLLRYYRKAKEYREKGCKTEFMFKEHLFTLLRFELGEFRPSEASKAHPELTFDGCHLGQSCTILPNGNVMACRRMESVIGDVKTESLHNILTGELCKSYSEIRDIKKCKDCELIQWCRGCRAVGYNMTGDLKGEDPCCWKDV